MKFTVIDTTNGNIVNQTFDSLDEAEIWIDNQDIPEKYEINNEVTEDFFGIED